MSQSFFKTVKQQWALALRDKRFVRAFLPAFAGIVLIASFLPSFYKYIENRQGIILNDWLLHIIPAQNVSFEIFSIIWGTVFFVLYRALLSPEILLRFLYAYVLFIITRSLCLLVVPLDPPTEIMELVDPITDIFYGGTFITKDLFYSGHTCTMVIVCLSMEKKQERIILGFLSVVLMFLLLIQHVHYTVDIVFGVIFGIICSQCGKRILQKMPSFVKE